MRPEGKLERLPGIRPWPSVWRALDAAFRRAFPFVSIFAVLLLLAFPLPIPAEAELRLGFALASVFFWTVYRPNSMPASAAMLLGLFADLLGPEPPGITALMLLSTRGFAMHARLGLIRRGFPFVWLAFGLVAAVATLAQWALTSALDLRLLPALPALLAAGLAIGFYPVLSVLLAEAHGSIAAPEQA